MKEKRILYHTRLIPKEHLNMDTAMAKAVVENHLCDTASPQIASILNEYGIDIVETRLVWWEFEKERGKFDFARLEKEIKEIKNAGMKVGLFPWLQHPPEWIVTDDSYTKLRCVEHGEDSRLISIWDEKLLEEYDRLLGVIAKRFKDEIDYFYVSVYGDFGELVFHSNIKHYVFSPEHNHTGIWSGDKKAKKSYTQYLKKKYKSEAALNSAWNTKGVSFEQTMFFTENDNFTKRNDFAVWYCGSLQNFADKVCAIVRKYFPDKKIGLPIGFRHEQPEFGQIKSISAKIAAKYKMTARWSGWADFGEFEMSNICARRIASAAKFYGTDFAVEAALYLDGKTATHALFEALSNSAGMMHNDPGNIIRGMDVYKMFKDAELSPLYQCKIAVFYPIEGELSGVIDCMLPYYEEISKLRRSFDYEIVDSYMIKDGFLDGVDTLVFAGNMPITKETADIIRQYAEDKGLKLLCMNENMPYLVDLKEKEYLNCEIMDKEIVNNPTRIYTTEFPDYTLIFDAEKNKIYKK